MIRGLVVAAAVSMSFAGAGVAHADDGSPPQPTPWPTGCQSPLVIGGTPAARKWCGAPLFGFGPMGPVADQPHGEQPVAEPPT
jgi:hypothetical protein